MSMTIEQIREAIRAELLQLAQGQGVDPEFADLVKVEGGDSGAPIEYDIARPRPSNCQCTDSVEGLLASASQRTLRKGSESFARTADFRKQLYEAGIRTGQLQPNSDLALFLGGSEEQARTAVRRLAS